MKAGAYLLPPISGFIAYLKGRSPDARLHGLQSVALGFVWPLALYLGSFVSPGVTQLLFALGAFAWLGLLGATAAGKNPTLPGARPLLERASARSPLERE